MATFQQRYADVHECAVNIKKCKVKLRQNQAIEETRPISSEVLKAFDKMISESLNPNAILATSNVDEFVLAVCLVQKNETEKYICIMEIDEEKNTGKIYFEKEITEFEKFVYLINIRSIAKDVLGQEGIIVGSVIPKIDKEVVCEKEEKIKILEKFTCTVKFVSK